MFKKKAPAAGSEAAQVSTHAVVREGADFERDLERERSNSATFAWRVAGGATILAAVFASLLGIREWKYEPVAFLVTVDKQTGESSVVKRLGAETLEFDVMHDKHNLKRYVEARESYNYTFLQRDYDLTMDMSCEREQMAYGKQFDGDKALDKVLGAGTEWRISVVGVRPLPNQPGQAVVTFEKTVKTVNSGQVSTPQRYNATINYEYKPNVKKKESVWIENPTGFLVCGYRSDPEFASK